MRRVSEAQIARGGLVCSGSPSRGSRGADRAGCGDAAAPAQARPGRQRLRPPGRAGHSGGSGDDAWYVFEPVKPRPRRRRWRSSCTATTSSPATTRWTALIRHTVRKGSVVIYPRWQTDIASPCPGPFDIEPCIASAVNGDQRRARATCARDPKRVQPQLRKTSYFGFSFGGIITANLANRYRALGLPKPRAIFLDDPHDGGSPAARRAGARRLAAGIPPSAKFQCHSGADGVLAGPRQRGRELQRGVSQARTTSRRRTRTSCSPSTDDHGEPDALVRPRRLRRRTRRRARRLRLELLLEGLGRAAQLRDRRQGLPVRARRHAQASLPRQVERRGPGRSPLKVQDAAPIGP